MYFKKKEGIIIHNVPNQECFYNIKIVNFPEKYRGRMS